MTNKDRSASRRLGRFNHCDRPERLQRFGRLLAMELLFASVLSQGSQGRPVCGSQREAVEKQ